MSYKTILVSLSDLERNAALLDSAARLARALDAHLDGLYTIPAVQIYAGIGLEPVILEDIREMFRKAERSVRASFETTLKNNGLRGTFEAVDSPSPDITDQVIDRARRSDVVIISQPAEDSNERRSAERIMLSAGRPTIVLPQTGKTSLEAGLAIVGWSGTREAARAAFDALPLLRSAGKVEVVWVNPQKDLPYERGLPDNGLTNALSRHGINAAFTPISVEHGGAGEALLKVVADRGADLLVMGAYGHSRLSEMILGGATRAVLKDMHCPVLFSH